MSSRSWFGGATALLTAVAVSACGSSAKPAAAVKSGAVAEAARGSAERIVRAADVSSAEAGYKVALTEHVATQGTNLNATATGSYSPPAHEASLTMSLDLPGMSGGATQIQLVLSGGTIFFHLPASMAAKIPGGKAWLSISLAKIGKLAGLPGFGSLVNDSSSIDNPTEYLSFLRAVAAGSVKDLGPATVNSIPTTHYQAEVDFSKLADAVPAADRQATQQLVDALSKKAHIPDFPVDIWIDNSSLVRRLQENLTETVGGKSVTVDIIEDFLAYGPQPAPTVPSSDQTLDLASLVPGG